MKNRRKKFFFRSTEICRHMYKRKIKLPTLKFFTLFSFSFVKILHLKIFFLFSGSICVRWDLRQKWMLPEKWGTCAVEGVRHQPLTMDGSSICLHIQNFALSLKGRELFYRDNTHDKQLKLITGLSEPQILRLCTLKTLCGSLVAPWIELFLRSEAGPIATRLHTAGDLVGWLVRFKSNSSLVGPEIISGMSSVGECLSKGS